MEIHTLLLLIVASHGVAGIWLSKETSPVNDTVKFDEDFEITQGVALKIDISNPPGDRDEGNDESILDKNDIGQIEPSSLKKNPMCCHCFLLKKESPDRPQNCYIDEVFGDNCVVHWREPNNDGGTEIKWYEVEALDTNAGTDWVLVKEAQPTERQQKITNLVNRHSYRFRVFAGNKIGKSPPCEMSGNDIYMMDPVDRQLCEKFSDEIISQENFQIAKHIFETKQVEVWVEETILKYSKGTKRENLDTFIDNICRSLDLSPELDQKLRSALEQFKLTTESGDFVDAIDLQHPEFKSLYGHLIAVEEADKTITIALGIHKLHFKLSDQETQLTTKEIEAIKNDFCKQNTQIALKSKGLPILRKKTLTHIDAVHMQPNLPS